MAGERILIIEDNPDDVEFLLTDVLSPHGYLARTASSGPAGLRTVQKEPPDLVLLNLGLNDVTGAEMLRQLQIAGGPPVILMTPPGAEVQTLRALRLGARDALTKPFTAAEMAQAIARLLHQERLARERDWLVRKIAAANEELEFSLTGARALYDAGKTILSSLNLQDVLLTVVRAAVSVTLAEEGYLLLRDPDGDELYLRAAQNVGEDHATGFWVRVNDSVADHVVRSGEPIMLSAESEAPIPIRYWVPASTGRPPLDGAGHSVRSLINVPLRIQERVIGVLGVDNRLSRENLTRREVTLLSALADYAAIAINNARVYTRTQQTLRRRTREISALQAMGRAAAEPDQVKHVAWQALKHAIQVTDAIGGVVGLQNGHLANALVACGEQEGVGKISWVNLDGSLLKPEPRMESVVRHALVLGQPQWTQNRTFPVYLAAPIQQGSETVGAIGLQIHATPLPDCGHHIETRTQESLRFLKELADRVAEQLLHTRLFVEAAAAQQRTNLVLANISEGVCTVDKDLHITSANLALERITGWPQDELLGRRYDKIFAPQVNGKRLPAEQTLPGKALQESAVISTRSTILRQDSRRIPVTGTAALLRDTGGAVVGVLVTVRALASDAPRVQLEPMRDTFDPSRCYPVTLKPVIDQVVKSFQDDVADRSFQVRLAADLPFVMGDERKIELALASLIGDALAQGDPGQPIVIAASAADDEVVVAVEAPASEHEKPLCFSLPTLEENDVAQGFSD